MRGDRTEPGVIALYITICVVVSLSPSPPVVRAAVLVPLVMFVPGYAILLAWTRSGKVRAEGATIVVVSIAVSMAAVVLGGLAMNVVVSLTALSWTIYLVCLTTLACAVAWIRSPTDRAARPPNILPAMCLPGFAFIGSAPSSAVEPRCS